MILNREQENYEHTYHVFGLDMFSQLGGKAPSWTAGWGWLNHVGKRPTEIMPGDIASGEPCEINLKNKEMEEIAALHHSLPSMWKCSIWTWLAVTLQSLMREKFGKEPSDWVRRSNALCIETKDIIHLCMKRDFGGCLIWCHGVRKAYQLG